jgi:hypothetical protein
MGQRYTRNRQEESTTQVPDKLMLSRSSLSQPENPLTPTNVEHTSEHSHRRRKRHRISRRKTEVARIIITVALYVVFITGMIYIWMKIASWFSSSDSLLHSAVIRLSLLVSKAPGATGFCIE